MLIEISTGLVEESSGSVVKEVRLDFGKIDG